MTIIRPVAGPCPQFSAGPGIAGRFAAQEQSRCRRGETVSRRVIPYLVVAFCQYHKMHRSRARDAEKLWLKFFEERACKTARERVQCQTVSAGNKNPGDTIFCGQTGYNPVKLPIFCVCPLDKTTRWDYHRPCTDQGNDDEIGKSESRENLDSDDGTFSQAYFVYGKKKRRSQGTYSPGGAADDLISVS